MKKIFHRIEWCFWIKLIPRYWHAWMAYLMVHYIKWKIGPKAADDWIWAMTPYPAGPPFIHQYWHGFRMVRAGKDMYLRIVVEYDDQCMAEYREWRDKHDGEDDLA